VSTEVAAAAVCQCTHEPPHQFVIAQRSRLRGGVLLALQRVDERYPRREVFVTARELKMATDETFKACFVCVDMGFRETAIGIPKEDIELGLPPA
jgi:hypothetical protein